MTSQKTIELTGHFQQTKYNKTFLSHCIKYGPNIYQRQMLSKKINIFPFTALTLPSFSFQLKKGQKKHSGPTLSLKSSPMKRMFPNVRRLTWVSSSRRSFFFISSSSSCSEVHIKRAVVRDSQHSKF